MSANLALTLASVKQREFRVVFELHLWTACRMPMTHRAASFTRRMAVIAGDTRGTLLFGDQCDVGTSVAILLAAQAAHRAGERSRSAVEPTRYAESLGLGWPPPGAKKALLVVGRR